MSQIFQVDGQAISTAAVGIGTNVETTVLTFNALKVPFQNGKITLTGSLVCDTGTGTTSLTVRIRRNATAENVVLNAGGLAFTVSPSTRVSLGFAGTDLVPDGRDCVYTVTVQQASATGNGAAQPGSGGVAMVMSG